MSGLAKKEMQDRTEAARRRRGWRDHLYSRIKVSVRTMDIVIASTVVLILVVLALGILTAQK